MNTNRLALGSAAFLTLLLIATPALAGHGHGGGHAFGFGSMEKRGGEHHFGSLEDTHGNKHGELRALDRANDVADLHGQKGRTGAAAHQSDHGHAHGDSDNE